MIDISDVVARLEEFVRLKRVFDGIPGLAIAITDRTRTVHSGEYGVSDIASGAPVRKETLFQIGSIGKSFTDIALLQLQEQRRVDLQESVTEYLPWFDVRSRHAPITLHHLMTHTAGIPIGSEATMAPESEVWELRHIETSAPPGEFYHYSNTGYKVLGLILETVTGMPYAEVVSSSILEPLGMTQTAPAITNDVWQRSAVGYMWLEDDRPPARNGPVSPATWFESSSGDGSISSTADDMAKYVRMLMNRGAGPDARLISESSFELMTSPHVFCGEGGEKEHYGYGLSVREDDGRSVLSHTGGMVGYTSSMLMDMDFGMGIIVLTNSLDEPEQISRYFLRLLGASGRGDDLPEAVVSRHRCDPGTLSEYVGDYHGKAGVLRVSEKDGSLHSVVDGVDVSMECVKDDYFRLDHPDFRLFLVRFLRSGERLVGIGHGSALYLLEPADSESPAPPPVAWSSYVGHYRSYNPWLTNFRVVCRGQDLLFIEPSGIEQVLVPTREGTFRVGEELRSPETLSFDMVVMGKAHRASLSGGSCYRTFTP
jgi:D-alanyl-D-alanine carboxypeptidase